MERHRVAPDTETAAPVGDHRTGGPPPEPTGRPRAARPAGPGPAVEFRAPDEPTRIPPRAWGRVLKGTLREFQRDQLTDRAAALTYYGVLSLFPALLVLLSLLGVAGQGVTQRILTQLKGLAPGPARQILIQAVHQLQGRAGVSSAVAAAGVLVALWTASGYVGGFIRAANAVYDIREGRPFWKVLALRLAVTAVLMVLACAGALTVVFSGRLADRAGRALGVGHAGLAVWSVAKWPVLVVLAVAMIALLYWAAPNVRTRGVWWVTPGGLVALLIWLGASAGFAEYVAHAGSFNRTYGTLAGVVVFLVWLWITNLAVLLGLEFDAELARQRAVVGGYPPGAEPYVQPRSTETWQGTRP